MRTLIAAHTTLAPSHPGYVNVSREEGDLIITVRGDPKVRDGAYICGNPSDKGKPGRCTAGDDRCNNYCNLAPQKGPMADSPAPCVQTFEGTTVSVRLSAEEWASLSRELTKGASA